MATFFFLSDINLTDLTDHSKAQSIIKKLKPKRNKKYILSAIANNILCISEL